MANQNLTHHEELRYNYLMRNLNYLSPKEEAEYEYLRSKVEAFNQYHRNRNQFDYSHSNGSANYYESENSGDWTQEYYANDDYAYTDESPYTDYEQRQYTAQGLPVYDDEHSAHRSRKARQVAQARSQKAEAVAASKSPKSPRPKKSGRRRFRIKRILLTLAVILLAILAAMGYKFYKGFSSVGGNGKYSAAVVEKFNGQDTADGTNILILGSDKRVTQGSTDARTDSIMVLNVGNSDNKVKLVSFMRDTLVNIEGASTDAYSYDQKLNTAFNLGEQDGNQGAEYMRKTLKDNFDIDIKYYVMLDFETFAEAIDTLFPKGVEINAQFATVEGQDVSEVEVPDDLNSKDGVTPNQTISEGKQRMDGRTLLNYARFRKDDEGDFGRTKRQQQVMSAVLNQTKNVSKLFTGSEAIGKVFALTSTNVPYSFLATNAVSVMSDASNGIEQMTLPEYGDWVDDYDMYGGQALLIDFDNYKKELKKMGMR
ncbi:LCP family protein [Streptococcus dentapri]|uniref:Regulatory protein MsrR n=1 Tax=Streptococcus dentapri TaxID=573564 RepID=A0ABV8CZ46_9STRE